MTDRNLRFDFQREKTMTKEEKSAEIAKRCAAAGSKAAAIEQFKQTTGWENGKGLKLPGITKNVPYSTDFTQSAAPSEEVEGPVRASIFKR